MNSLSLIWFSYAINLLWQSSVVIAAVLLLYLILHKKAPSLKYLLLCIPLLKFILPTYIDIPGNDLVPVRVAQNLTAPALISSALMQTPNQHGPDKPQFEKATEISATAIPKDRKEYPAEAQQRAFFSTLAGSLRDLNWKEMIFILWAVAVIGLALGQVSRALRLKAFLSNKVKINQPKLIMVLLSACKQLGIHRQVDLYCHKQVASALVVGFLRPKVILPETMLNTLDERELKCLLLHELAHVKRWDLFVNLGQVLLQSIWFFHPGLWLINHLIRRERERACDDLAIHHSGFDSSVYASGIMKVVEAHRPVPQFAMNLLGISDRRSDLFNRIRRILSTKGVHRPIPNFAEISLIVLAAAIILPLSVPGKAGLQAKTKEEKVKSQDLPIFDIPYLDGIKIDGDPSDWGDKGFRIEVLTDLSGEIKPPEDHDVQARLAWDKEGMIVLVQVRDNVFLEKDDPGVVWQGDCVELHFAPKRGAPRFQATIAPGMDARFPGIKWFVWATQVPGTNVPEKPIKLQAASQKAGNGYSMEVRMPWLELGLHPAVGLEAAFQMYVGDADEPDKNYWDYYRVFWFPQHHDGLIQPNNQYSVRLAKKPSKPILVAGAGVCPDLKNISVNIVGIPSLLGHSLNVMQGAKKLANVSLSARSDGRAVGSFELPMPTSDQGYGTLTLKDQKETVGYIHFPELAKRREEYLLKLQAKLDSVVFESEIFPVPKFPDNLENLVGEYTTKFTYYDQSCKEVSRAEQSGRYGLVIEASAKTGWNFRQFHTLHRLAVNTKNPLDMNFPGSDLDDAKAIRLCAPDVGDPVALDNEWWAGLKRRIYGLADSLPKSNVLQKTKDRRATIVESSSVKLPDYAIRFDHLTSEWAQNGNIAAQACIAVNGTIVLNRAYGKLPSGAKMETKALISNSELSRLVSGILMAILADQGRVNMDDPIGKYLPQFRGPGWNDAIIRHLFIQEGRNAYWGGADKNLEENCGRIHDFANWRLGNRIIEIITGVQIGSLAQKHLFLPLACHNSRLSWAGFETTAEDAVKIGQLLLNKGTYGDLVLFKEATYTAILPRPLPVSLEKHQYGEVVGMSYGVGLFTPSDYVPPASKHALTASSHSGLFFDPENNLVFSRICRPDSKGYYSYSHFDKLFRDYSYRAFECLYEGLR